MPSFSPILLFTYNRANSLRQTIEALKNNEGAKESDLFVFSDGPKADKDIEGVRQVREILPHIQGFKKVVLRESPHNKGLAKSIIGGVSEIIEQYGKVIVLEDDLVTSTNFLMYMNLALEHYASNSQIFAICGFSMPMKGVRDKSVYFTQRGSSWGWATWKDQWKDIDWEVKDYLSFKNDANQRKAFNRMGSDMADMLDKQIEGQINSWAIRWCYHQFKTNTYSVHPVLSKVRNIGFGDDATHTRERYDRFKTKLDTSESSQFIFPDTPYLESSVIKQFVAPYSIATRIKHKLLNLLPF